MGHRRWRGGGCWPFSSRHQTGGFVVDASGVDRHSGSFHPHVAVCRVCIQVRTTVHACHDFAPCQVLTRGFPPATRCYAVSWHRRTRQSSLGKSAWDSTKTLKFALRAPCAPTSPPTPRMTYPTPNGVLQPPSISRPARHLTEVKLAPDDVEQQQHDRNLVPEGVGRATPLHRARMQLRGRRCGDGTRNRAGNRTMR